MEASGAGLAGGDAAGQGDAGGGVATADGQQQDGQQQDGQLRGDAAIAQLAEQVTGLQQQLEGVPESAEQMRQFLAQQAVQATQQQTQQQTEADRPDLSFLETETDPQVAAERLHTEINKAAEAKASQLLEQRLGPVEQQLENLQLQQETEALVAEFPELGDPAIAKQVLAAAADAAGQVGRPELAGNPAYVRQTYLAGRAMQLVQQQQQGAASAPGVATLEGAGGAGAGGSQQGEQQTGDSIAQEWGQRRSVLPRW